MQRHFLILVTVFFFSCKNTIKNLPDKTISDTSITRANNARDQETKDSLSLLKISDSSLVYAKQHKNEAFFKHNYETGPDDTSFIVTVQMLYGHLFSKNRKHLLVRKEVPWATYLSIYVLQKNDFKPVIEREQQGLTYIGDTSKDVNGDGYKDFLVHWYPSSGCCLANMFNVYLYKPKTGNFTSDYRFINPSFFPKEKIILGLEYDHPGDAGIYKYRWNNLKVDTVEFIYTCIDEKSKFIKTKYRHYRRTTKDGIILNELPKEYLKMDSEALKWFFGKY